METCKVCGKVHGKIIALGFASQETLDEFKLIQNKLSCARQAVTPSAIPDGIPEVKVKMFIQAAIDALASYQWLEQDLWSQTIIKYDLPKNKNVNLDFNNGMFYILEG